MNIYNNTVGIQPDLPPLPSAATTRTSHNNNTLNNQLQQNQQIIAPAGVDGAAMDMNTNTATTKKKKGEKKKDPNQPKRPMNLYTLFCRAEKERLIQMQDGVLSEEYKQGKELLSGMPSRFQNTLLPPDWDRTADNSNSSRRKHRKANTGKQSMNLVDLNKLLSDSWKEVKANDSETVKFFEEKRKGHLEQYEVAMKKWEDGGGKKEKKESKVQNTFTPKEKLASNKRSAAKPSSNAGNPIKKVRTGSRRHAAASDEQQEVLSLRQTHSPINTAKYLSPEYESEKQEWDNADTLGRGKKVMSTADSTPKATAVDAAVTSPSQLPKSKGAKISNLDDETSWGGNDTNPFDMDESVTQSCSTRYAASGEVQSPQVSAAAKRNHASNTTSTQRNLLSHTLQLKSNDSNNQGKENEKNGAVTDSAAYSSKADCADLLLPDNMTTLIEQASIDLGEIQKNVCAKGKQEVEVVMAEAKKKIVSITVKTAADNIDGILHVYENAVEKFEKQNTDQSLLDKQQKVKAELGPLMVESMLGDNSNKEKMEELKAEALTIKTEIERSQKMVGPFKKQLRKAMVERHTATKHLYYKQGKYPLPNDVIAKQEARLLDGLGCELSTNQNSE